MNVPLINAGIWVRGPRYQRCLRTDDGHAPLFSERYGYTKAWRFAGVLVKRQDANSKTQPRLIVWLRLWRFMIFHFSLGDPKRPPKRS